MNVVRVFAEGVVDQIKDYMPKAHQELTFEVQEKIKNNGVVMTGICVHVPGENMSPVIYMDSFYEQIKQGESKDTVMNRIASNIIVCRRSAIMKQEFDFLNFDSVKSKISPMLINAKANRQVLPNLCHERVEDLAIAYKIDVDVPMDEGRGIVKIDNKMLELWQVTPEDIKKAAFHNMEKSNEPVLSPMSEVAMNIVMDGNNTTNLLHEDLNSQNQEPMFVLTNDSKYYGAASLLYPGVLDRVSELFPEGFYILPSSVHETLIVPKDGMNPKDLGNMVREVNREMVDPEEILSDRVYEYNKELGRIQQVPESIQKSREAER